MLTFATGFPTLDLGNTIKSGNSRTGTPSESGFFGLLNSMLQRSTPISGTATTFSSEQRQALLSGARDQLGQQLKLAGIDDATLSAFYTAEPETMQLTHLLEQIAGQLLPASPMQQATQWLAEANSALVEANTTESNTLNPDQWREWFLLMEKFSTSSAQKNPQENDGEKGFAHLRQSLLLGAMAQSVTTEKDKQKPELNGAEIQTENLFALQQIPESLPEIDESETETLAALRQIVQSLQEALREMNQLTESIGINPNDYPTAFAQIFQSIDAMKDQQKALTEMLTAVMESFSQPLGEGANATPLEQLPLSETGKALLDTLTQTNFDLRQLLQNWQNTGAMNPTEALPQLAQSLASIQMGLSRAVAIPAADGASVLQIVQRDYHALLFGTVSAVENLPQDTLFSNFKEQQPRRDNPLATPPETTAKTGETAVKNFAVAETSESEANKAPLVATSTKTDPASQAMNAHLQATEKDPKAMTEATVEKAPVHEPKSITDGSTPAKATDSDVKASTEPKISAEPKTTVEPKTPLLTNTSADPKIVTLTQTKSDLPVDAALSETDDDAENTIPMATALKKDISKESDTTSHRTQLKEPEKIADPLAPKTSEERERIAQAARIAAMEQPTSDTGKSIAPPSTAIVAPNSEVGTEKIAAPPIPNNTPAPSTAATPSSKEQAEPTSLMMSSGSQNGQTQDQNSQDTPQQQQSGREWMSRETVAPRTTTSETPATPLTSREIEDATDQIIRKVTMSTRGELKTLTIALRPEYMGKVNIRLSVEAGVLTARVMVENPSLRHGLEQTSTRIQEAISSLGLKVERFDIVQPFAESQSSHNGNQFANTQFQQGQENQQRKNRSLSSDQRGAPQKIEDEPQGGENQYHYRTSQSLNLIA